MHGTIRGLRLPSIRLAEPPLGWLQWKHVAIRECGEPLVKLSRTQRPGRVLSRNAYHCGKSGGAGELARILRCGLDANPEVRVRRSVSKRLDAVQLYLDSTRSLRHLQLLALSGYRSLETQRALFEAYSSWLQSRHTNWSAQTLRREAERMVSAVPSADLLAVSPPHHTTGGAIDVVLVPKSLGAGEDAIRSIAPAFGAEFDEMFHPRFEDKRSALVFYETKRQHPARRYRRLLWMIMTAVGGFTGYGPEWWHYQTGTQLDALLKNEPFAKFGYSGI